MRNRFSFNYLLEYSDFKRIFKVGSIFAALFTLSSPLCAQMLHPDKPDSGKKCAICHFQWVYPFYTEHRDGELVPQPKEKMVATAEMCFSCHDGNVVALMNRAAEVGGIDAILFRYNFRRYGDLELNRAIDACHRTGIGLLAMKTQGSVPRDLESVVGFRSKEFTLGQAKLKSVWADERINSIVSEMDSVRYVRENVAAARSEKPLTAEESHQLNQLAALTAGYACNGCKHLCEQTVVRDVAIAESLRYLMYFESYGKADRARELYRAIPVAKRAASDEELCRACQVCPQGIDIPARLRRARELLA